MSGGTTYSRSDGTDLLEDTWGAIKDRVDAGEILDPAHRSQYEAASKENQQRYDRLIANEKIPNDMGCARAPFSPAPADYPGAVDQSLGHQKPVVLNNTNKQSVANRLGISTIQLERELANFSGEVTLFELPEGTTIYRTIGLVVNEKSMGKGEITNKLLGQYFEVSSPDKYESIIEFYQKTAVKIEWNGDQYHVAYTIKKPVYALVGTAGMQHIGDGRVLPGGAGQYYIQGITEEHINEEVSLNNIIKTQFGKRHS
ncbi:hypothetical protein [Acidithiobacillus sp.]|uniref:hypothetical protein n=1 Tax=Acidithiobacillus sp. TaxID=1872118 RepID=UPI00260E870C|nr:hypothetical protein [Acidithiobacillus sp.]MDD5278723.1 hypothetical protein [Acidithiobacillus sp.]